MMLVLMRNDGFDGVTPLAAGHNRNTLKAVAERDHKLCPWDHPDWADHEFASDVSGPGECWIEEVEEA